MTRRKRKSITLHPIMTFVVLILITVIASGILELAGLSANYNLVNSTKGNIETVTVSVTSLFGLSGIKQIFSTTVSNFASFAPLSTLLIALIGIGIMDKSGFLQSFFALITKHASKNMTTFVFALITILLSVIGDISFIVMIPISALFFKYCKRNPKAGIIMSFAGLTCGTGINIFMNSVETALMEYSLLSAKTLDSTYTISSWSYLFIMLILTFVMAYVITIITEKIIIPKLGKYEETEETEEFYLDNHKKRGLLFSITVGVIYILIFVYNIIPGLPFSGNLLDNSQVYYIDKLFGYNSFFNQGFVFVITFLFFILGFFYGIGAKTIKNNRDVSEYLGHSLDDIGKTLVLLFFASTFISVFKETNIGTVLTAIMANFISTTTFTGIPLIFLTFICSILITFLVPSPTSAWSILSGVIVPVFMNSGMTAEFSELVFRAGECVSYGLTPIMAYFVIYLAFLDKYSEEDKPIDLRSSIKYILPFSGATALVWIIILILIYVLGVPMGIGTSAIL